MSLNIAKSNKKRVVIVGGGFGGLKLANKPEKVRLSSRIDDKNNYHLVSPFDLSGGFGRYGTDFHLFPFS